MRNSRAYSVRSYKKGLSKFGKHVGCVSTMISYLKESMCTGFFKDRVPNGSDPAVDELNDSSLAG